MTTYLHVIRLERVLVDGEIEEISFTKGVNVISGPSNSGKTTWLRILDYILGKDEKITDVFHDDVLARKYHRYIGYFDINGQNIVIHRTPFSQGSTTKVFINDIEYTTEDFSIEILRLLNIPSDVKFPKGNPYTSAWVDISFRILYRHIYRREDHWGDIADRQPINEQYAAQYQLFGIADKIYSVDFNQQIKSEKQLALLEIRKEQFTIALDKLVEEMSPKNEEDRIFAANENEIQILINKLENEIKNVEKQRNNIVEDKLVELSTKNDSLSRDLAERRASLLIEQERVIDMRGSNVKTLKYYSNLLQQIEEELTRLKRTKKTGIISDLRVTHCPACDQEIKRLPTNDDLCFVCSQKTDNIEKPYEERVDFEIAQLNSEKEELIEITSKLNKDLIAIGNRLERNREEVAYLERNIAPIKTSLYALTNEQVSALDVKRGRLEEQIQNLKRLIHNIDYKHKLNQEIFAIEKEIVKTSRAVESQTHEIDFNTIAEDLGDSMQVYVDRISMLRPDIWVDKGKISVTITDSRIAFYVNNKSWNALSKLDKDIFLLAYHYGMLCLTSRRHYRYPGLVIIDLHADLGESVASSYNYLVAPFEQLCTGLKEQKPLQVIITGRRFDGLKNVNHITLDTTWKVTTHHIQPDIPTFLLSTGIGLPEPQQRNTDERSDANQAP